MRLPRFRFTVRRLMVVVAVVAIAIEAGMIGLRWRDYRRRAFGHASLEKIAADCAELCRQTTLQLRDESIRLEQQREESKTSEEEWHKAFMAKSIEENRAFMQFQNHQIEFYSKNQCHHRALATKYYRASHCPWLPVPPDPPEPKYELVVDHAIP